MTDYVSNTTVERIAERLGHSRRVALTTHAKPDGDAMGSALALARALRAPERTADVILVGPLDDAMTAIAEDTPYQLADETHTPSDDYDVIVLVDTGAWSQLGPLADWFRRHRERVIGVDHHARGDDVAAERLIDPGAAATAQMVVPLLDALGATITGGRGGIAEALFVGLATDTGWFRYDTAGAETYAVAARLLEAGVDKGRLFELIEETHQPVRLELEARALASLEYVDDGRVAILSLGADDFSATGGKGVHLTGIVNLPLIVGTVRVSILLAEEEPGRTKISLRSKPSTNGQVFTDVNAVAAELGGGGHVCAAGARVNMSMAEARAAVLAALARAG